MRPALPALAVAALAGLLLGVATQLGQAHLPDVLRPLANSVSPWLAVAFGVGAIAPRPLLAAASAFVALVVALAGYYAMVQLQFGYGASSIVVLWLLAAVAGGVVFGPGGWWWRNGSGWTSAVPLGLLAAAFIADGLYVYSVVQSPEKPAAVLYLVIGAVLPALLGGSASQRRLAYVSVLPGLALGALGFVGVGMLFGGG